MSKTKSVIIFQLVRSISPRGRPYLLKISSPEKKKKQIILILLIFLDLTLSVWLQENKTLWKPIQWKMTFIWYNSLFRLSRVIPWIPDDIAWRWMDMARATTLKFLVLVNSKRRRNTGCLSVFDVFVTNRKSCTAWPVNNYQQSFPCIYRVYHSIAENITLLVELLNKEINPQPKSTKIMLLLLPISKIRICL